ncbi:MAG: phosphoglucosamine mutase [Pyrinomonadaceae bacterium]
MDKLFGTDGIRGLAGVFPLDAATVQVIGTSVAQSFRDRVGRPARFITGRDTRESGAGIEAAFHAGATTAGASCESAGVITTPGVAYLAGAFHFDAGVVVSASHNPYQDNGIKIFLASGRKIDDAFERLIQGSVESAEASSTNEIILEPPVDAVKRIAYAMHLHRAAENVPANSLKLVVDCANGAASKFAGRVFTKAVAEVITINDHPDGRNINAGCGSLHLDKLREAVLSEKADLGVAFDGDADRALFVDAMGKVVDGDATLWILASYLQNAGKLHNSTVVATVMSNIGLELALKTRRISLLRTSVGDKYVLEKLTETGSEIGGEQSGHIIFSELSLVGDGMMTALLLLRALVEGRSTLSAATHGFTPYPQILLNIPVVKKPAFDSIPAIDDAAKAIEGDLQGEGRLLLRYSGTENLARVMIEGKDERSISEQAHRLGDIIKRALG